MSLLKIFDFILDVGASPDLASPVVRTLMGYNHKVYQTNDGTDATIIQDYLRKEGIKSKIDKPIGGWCVTVRREDQRLAKSLLSRK